jgi:hypothetical protein
MKLSPIIDMYRQLYDTAVYFLLAGSYRAGGFSYPGRPWARPTAAHPDIGTGLLEGYPPYDQQQGIKNCGVAGHHLVQSFHLIKIDTQVHRDAGNVSFRCE